MGSTDKVIVRQGYGIILGKRSGKTFEYLLVRRRHTYAYVDLVCGRYNVENIPYILKLCLQLTAEERVNLCMKPFEYIWNELWLYTDSGSRNYKHAYDKFIYIKSSNSKIKLQTIIRKVKCTWNEPEWGFPKGRQENNETPINCALRELYEETNIDISQIQYKHEKKINEIVKGTNNLMYSNTYFIAFSNNNLYAYLDKDNLNQYQEIGDVGWFTYSECLNKFREYEDEKKKH